MRFNLKEIQEIISLKRFSNWVEPETISQYNYMLQTKRDEIKTTIQSLQDTLEKIDQEHKRILQMPKTPSLTTEVPLTALLHLHCPYCGKQLQLYNATLSYKFVRSGSLFCACGYDASIERGVVVTRNRYTQPYDKPDLKRELYHGLCPDFLKLHQHCSNKIMDALHAIDLKGKIVMENNINGYFCLYTHLKELPKNCLYIFIDKFPETIYMYKELIDSLNLDLDIFYVADASLNYPLEKNCVDVGIDFFACNEHQFYHDDTLIEATGKYFSEHATILGSYMSLPPNARSRQMVKLKYPESASLAYTFSNIRHTFKANDFTMEWHLIGSVMKTQNQFSFECHLDNEELRTYHYVAWRSRQKSCSPQTPRQKDKM